VPNLIGLFAKFDACNLALALLVEQPDLLDLSGLWGRSRRFTRDEENRAFCSLEQFRRHLTEEKLVARPRAYTHHQETVTPTSS
jgi:hypothetical protein